MSKNLILTRPIPESYWVVPGRLLAGEHPCAAFAPDITRQRLNAFLEVGFETIINLTQENEVVDYAILLQEQARSYGMQVECPRFPIGDFGLPDPGLMKEILDEIDHALDSRRKVYVHCYGGIGRTGTVVGCFLVRHGYSGQLALLELAGWWRNVPKSVRHPDSPETFMQKEFVLNWDES
ncbi:MAG: hypothetical protein NTW32_14505 [Chloroflexi bacterium]|nr:hypothetical protein [Chloroflexota bacterium]